MKIVLIGSNVKLSNEQEQKLSSLGELTNYNVKKLDGDEIVELIGDAEIAIVSIFGVKKLDAEVLERCSKLRFISILGAGFDFIDINKASELGIKISNAQGGNAQSVAEHAWGMILGLSKRISSAYLFAITEKDIYEDMYGFELSGKTIGIIGLGQIGSRVAKMASAFDMKVIAYDKFQHKVKEVDFVELDVLFKLSDVIVVAAPLNEDTRDLIGIEELEKMKSNVILINVAREAIIDENAILESLQKGKLFGFAMETDINKPVNKRFYDFARVIITPHTASWTAEADARVSELAVENVLKFIEGKTERLIA